MKIGRVLALAAWICLLSMRAFAEGSAEFDIGETLWNGTTGNRAHDQAVTVTGTNPNTVIRVDIASGGAEKVCWTGTGTLQLRNPSNSNVGSAIASGNCVAATTGTTGAYYAVLSANQLVGTEWDIRVCLSSVSDANCLGVANNEQRGRVWSAAWSFWQNPNFTNDYAINGSVYAVVPGGGMARDAVVELQMNGVSGAWYVLRANSTGPIVTAGGARFGRSSPVSGYTVNAEYPLYLSPPATAQYNWTTPLVSNVALTPSCGTSVVLGRASGQISFNSNVTGQYVVVCDVDKDNAYDFAGTTDFSAFGNAVVGTNTVTWNGRNNASVDAAQGTYQCVIRLNVGEFHYVAEDIETAYPGIRMYRVEADRTTRTPIAMFWDDRSATLVAGTRTMPNGQAGPTSPLAAGLDPTARSNAAAPFYFTGGNRAQPNGNARAWGNFNTDNEGPGNNNYLDQFSAAATAISPPISIQVITSGGDFDSDGLTNTRECDLRSLPEDNDTDNDGVRDGYEATSSTSPNTDGDTLIDVLDNDDDGDGIPTATELGAGENGDGNPADAANSDNSGARDYLDTDSDEDGVADGPDSAPRDPNVCRDADADGCNDCARGTDNPNDDGPDYDGDGRCDAPGDFDGDGLGDGPDLDDDGDGILDRQENTAGLDPAGDADNDGIVNRWDPDNRGDGMANDCAHTRNTRACDALPTLFDRDGDGQANHLDLDADGDGRRDASESGHDAPDADGDGRVDGALGNNGVADAVESAPDSAMVASPIDTDGDQLPDFLDRDSDGDGVEDGGDAQPRDARRCRDADGDGCDDCTSGKDDVKNDGSDEDGDGQCARPADSDGDGVPDDDDLDDDGDGILDSQENEPGLEDRDGDGIPNQLDLDADGDGIFDADESGHDARDADRDGRVDGPVGANGVADAVESAPESGVVAGPRDTDDDATPDFLDVDSDGDRVDDDAEAGDTRPNTPARDSDQDGVPDYRDLDDDDDGIDTTDERGPGGEEIDSDGDGESDHLDVDDDDDGIPSGDELTGGGQNRDSDRDGTPDRLDPDDDGDGVETRLERSKEGLDLDTDGDDQPDHLDVDDDGDGIPTAREPDDADGDGVPDRLVPNPRGTLSGGALCSLALDTKRAPDLSTWVLLGVLGVWLGRRKKKADARTKWLGLLGLITLLATSSGTARAQVALEQFKPAPLARDGFALSRPEVLEKGSWSAALYLDYANDPLVYELRSGSSRREERVVAHHLVGHVGVAFGVVSRLTLFANLPVHMVMKGDKRLSFGAPKPEGAGLGDIAVGGRVLLSSLDPKAMFAAALELIARAPTADLANKDQHYSGDAIGSYEPALIGELRRGRFDVRLRAGARLRQRQKVANLTLSHEWLAGLGMRVRVFDTLYLHAEAYGSTFMNKPFKRTANPIEALFGIKHQGEAWNVGVAAGPGLRRGYGSPDVRVVAMVGHAPGEQKPRDSDGDGLLDPHDRCPKEPEDVDHFEDADGCPDLDNDKDGLPDSTDSCIDEPEDTDDYEDTDGCPDPDDDKDGILDQDDACPRDHEDIDGFEDGDGCPDADNDKDGILDQVDACRDRAEDVDGFEDEDGCPEPGGGKVKLSCDRIEIGESVYFDTGKDTIQSRSFELLDQVARLLATAKHVLKLRVAGHTDDRGNDKKNLDLSQRRAASVLRHLIAHGVEAARLESEGYGESQPIADNKSADGRAQNRRVEFQILEQSGECRR